MVVYAFVPVGYEGRLVRVEVDLRRGLPAFDLTGLPDDAVKEARARVRSAVRNSGFEFPVDRLLVNLAPAGVRKTGASFDLPIALAILVASGQVPHPGVPVLATGELLLSGDSMPTHGVLSAVQVALAVGIQDIIVPPANAAEGRALGLGTVRPLARLSDAVELFEAIRRREDFCAEAGVETLGMGILPKSKDHPTRQDEIPGDFSDVRGQPLLRRAMEVAAAGGHHLMLFGPPGSGKTLAATRFVSLLPDLERRQSIETTAIHSLANSLDRSGNLIVRPPFRSPHHGASAEGVVGGGRYARPGEISLAHGGVLFLDEAPEFRTDILQSLREPIEEGRISIARAESSVCFPARFQLIMAANPCPCGNLGRPNASCLCSENDVRRYWKRLGGPLLDRIDIRVPVELPDAESLCGGPGESSAIVRMRVQAARRRQGDRYYAFKENRPENTSSFLNADLPPGDVTRVCALGAVAQRRFVHEIETAGLSGRGAHSVLKVARTIADLAKIDEILQDHIEEAIGLRRFGETDVFWRVP